MALFASPLTIIIINSLRGNIITSLIDSVIPTRYDSSLIGFFYSDNYILI